VATVQLEHVSKTFKSRKGDVRALTDLSLIVGDREFVVLVGPSGCGKSTTLRLIAGLEEPSAGTIRIGARDVGGVPPKDRDVAMVFQNYALYPHMTVFGNIAFGLKMRRVPAREIKQRVQEVARTLDVGHLLERKPGGLSGGECQRVALGRAIVRDPKIFLFDEPLSNLDARLRGHMRTELKALHRSLTAAIIYVTHDQEEAMTLGDRVVVMRQGVVQQCGPPLEVYNSPANRFVGDFIGSPSMNFLEGHLEDHAELVSFVAKVGRFALPPTLRDVAATPAGAGVVLGIRPEHVRVATPGTSPGGAASVEQQDFIARVTNLTVSVVEPLGNSVHIHVATSEGQSFVACAPPTTAITPGQRVNVLFDMSRIHLFAAGTCGARLSRPERASPAATGPDDGAMVADPQTSTPNRQV